MRTNVNNNVRIQNRNNGNLASSKSTELTSDVSYVMLHVSRRQNKPTTSNMDDFYI